MKKKKGKQRSDLLRIVPSRLEAKADEVSDIVINQRDVRNEVIPVYEMDLDEMDDVEEESSDENIDEEQEGL